MCGICGIVHAEPARPVDPARIRWMTDAILHRGPDDDGYFIAGPVGIGMRRLSIIDLDEGQQPVANEDGSVRLVQNGEIYNYRELRHELERAGHAFATRSDTEVLVHAYEEHGTAFLERLRGMFGIAVWDRRMSVLTLAVDRFGIKPLYYAANEDGIVFGSELKCLLLSGAVTPELDHDALAQYFTFRYIPPPATIFSGVRKLAPGCVLRWSPNGPVQVKRYWISPPDQSDTRSTLEETRARLRAALVDSVRSHLVSDVPVGAFLSGGIDSSALVALMSEASSEPVRTFSIGFADQRYSELDQARTVARGYATDHHELVVEPETVDMLPRLVSHFDEPFADPSALPTYHVSRLARQHVKVVLSGDGGDELFIGYTLFQGLRLAQRLQILPSSVRRLLTSLPSHVPTLSDPDLNDRLELVLKRIADTVQPPDAAFKRKISAPGLSAVRPLLSPELSDALGERQPFAVVDRWLDENSSLPWSHPLERFVHAGFQTSLAGDMLVKVDRMSMANSLEVRVPFLDHVLAEHVATIPIERRIPGGRLKGLLKDTVADLLPEQILKQPKRGFAVPLAAWFRGDVATYVREVLLSPDTARHGFLDTRAVERMLSRDREGAARRDSLIWSLLMFELWCRQALDGASQVGR